MSTETAESRRTEAEQSIPSIIRAAGERAIHAYWEFLNDPARSPSTRKLYRVRAAKFFGWAESRGLTLEAVDGDVLAAYADEVAAASSRHEASVYMTPVRGVLGRMTNIGVLPVDPCRKGQPNGRKALAGDEQASSDRAATAPDIGPGPVGFPLLDLLAMLGNLEKLTLQRVLEDEGRALSLLHQVRWPDGRECPYCGACASGESADTVTCESCGKPYSVTSGTMFDGSRVAVRAWLAVMRQLYFPDPAAGDGDVAGGVLDTRGALSMCRCIMLAMTQQGLPAGNELSTAIAVRNRELGEEQVGRSIVEYGQLEWERNRLLQAQADNSPVDGLPPGMSLLDALAFVEARIAEHDRYAISVRDGYLVQELAETARKPADSGHLECESGQH